MVDYTFLLSATKMAAAGRSANWAGAPCRGAEALLTTGWVKSRPKGDPAPPRAGLRKLRCTVRQHAKKTTSRIASRQPKRMPEQSGPQIDHRAPSAPRARDRARVYKDLRRGGKNTDTLSRTLNYEQKLGIIWLFL